MENIEAKQPKWEELGISNDFLFGKVMQDAELCKELLQRILPDLDIDHVEYPELQKTIKAYLEKAVICTPLRMSAKKIRRSC